MKTYITHVPHRRDPKTGAFVQSVNLGPAEEHGEVVVMMPPRASFFDTASLVRQLREHLKHYDYERGDSIIALGDPSVIAAACALLGAMFGRFIILKWDRNTGRYIRTHVNVAA